MPTLFPSVSTNDTQRPTPGMPSGSPALKGIALVQLIDKRKLKFEAFPGKNADQVSEFTSRALIYER